jgi:hypothetical protein
MPSTFEEVPVTVLSDIIMEHRLSEEKRKGLAMLRAAYGAPTNAEVLRRALEIAARVADRFEADFKRRNPSAD